MRRFPFYLLVNLFCCWNVHAQEIPNTSLELLRSGDTITVSNNLVSYTVLWKNAGFNILELKNKQSDSAWKYGTIKPQLAGHYFENIISDSIIIDRIEGGVYTNSKINIKSYGHNDKIKILQTLSLNEFSTAISVTYFVKGIPIVRQDTSVSKDVMTFDMIEESSSKSSHKERMGYIDLVHPHWSVQTVQFREATDYHDNPVQDTDYYPFRQEQLVHGNVIVAESFIDEISLWVIKESPIGGVQVGYLGFDFAINNNNLSVAGPGVDYDMLSEDTWQQAYGFSLGISAKNEYLRSRDILIHQKSRRKFVVERDAMHLANTWGDRSRDARMNESFILRELQLASYLGITHLQLDDGWQSGLSKNSADKEGQVWDDWKKADWEPHPLRFPNGFDSIMKLAASTGVEICLWFNPSKVDNYANWERDADILLSYYKKYGIRVYKIDGISLGNRQSETNLRSFFDKVSEGTFGSAVFNLDVTAGKRIGFHFFNEYGNIFLENRYTDWGNYYPYRTLQNAHSLGKYIPLEKLQLEFLNNRRNMETYGKADLLSPFNTGMELAYLMTILGQPLAWMELSNDNLDSDKLKNAIHEGKKLKELFNKSVVIPLKSKETNSTYSFLIESENGSKKFLLVYLLGNQKEVNLDLPQKFSFSKLIFSNNSTEDADFQIDGYNFRLSSENSNSIFLLELKKGEID